MNDLFMTVDVALAAFLQEFNHKLLSTELSEDNRVRFAFANTDAVKKDAAAFFNNAPAPARSMYRRLGRLRDLIRDVKQNNSQENANVPNAQHRTATVR